MVNIGEACVFFNLLPDSTLDFKCRNCTKSKERLTAVLSFSETVKIWLVLMNKNSSF